MSRSLRVRASEQLEDGTAAPEPAVPTNKVNRGTSRARWAWLGFAGDAGVLAGAFFLAYWLRYGLRIGPELTEFQLAPLIAYWPVGLGFGAAAIVQLYLRGVYDQRRRFRWLDEVPKLFNSTLFATAAVIVVFFLFRPAFFSRLMFGYLFVLALVGLSTWRLLLRFAANWRHRRGKDLENVLVVGSGNAAKMLMQQMHAISGLGLKLVGFVDEARENGRDFGRFQRLGTSDDIEDLSNRHELDRVFHRPSSKRFRNNG